MIAHALAVVDFRGESAPRFNNPGNDDLKPEKTATFELGLDTALLDDRVAINFTYYTQLRLVGYIPTSLLTFCFHFVFVYLLLFLSAMLLNQV